MDEPYTTFKEKNGKHLLKIYTEDSPESPRDWDNMGTMICFHNKYGLGDDTNLKSEDFEGWKELENHLMNELNAEVILSIYLYDHSEITINTEGNRCSFDSGQVGFIYVTKEDLIKNYKEGTPTKELIKLAKDCLKLEVETYNQFIRGEVYGFRLITMKTCDKCGHSEEIEEGSGWGFYGENFEKNGLFETAGMDLNDYEEVEGK